MTDNKAVDRSPFAENLSKFLTKSGGDPATVAECERLEKKARKRDRNRAILAAGGTIKSWFVQYESGYDSLHGKWRFRYCSLDKKITFHSRKDAELHMLARYKRHIRNQVRQGRIVVSDDALESLEPVSRIDRSFSSKDYIKLLVRIEQNVIERKREYGDLDEILIGDLTDDIAKSEWRKKKGQK